MATAYFAAIRCNTGSHFSCSFFTNEMTSFGVIACE